MKLGFLSIIVLFILNSIDMVLLQDDRDTLAKSQDDCPVHLTPPPRKNKNKTKQNKKKKKTKQRNCQKSFNAFDIKKGVLTWPSGG